MSDEPIVDECELQWRLIYSILVAGKTATFAHQATRRLLADRADGETPFEYLRRVAENDGIGTLVRAARTGNYGKTAKALGQLAASTIDLRTCSAHRLELIHGVGPKTARFFLLWTRPDERCAALDVHVLRWLRANGYPEAPRSTPSSRRAYHRLEQGFLREADRRGLKPRQLDTLIWDAANVGGIC